MGVDASRVKMALQRRALQSRPMYANVNELLDAAFREQREQVSKCYCLQFIYRVTYQVSDLGCADIENWEFPWLVGRYCGYLLPGQGSRTSLI